MRPSDRFASGVSGIVIALLLAPLVVHIGFVLAPGVGSYAVTTGSMTPTLEQGSMIYVHDTGDYETGDVVTFSHQGAVVTHRIVERTETGFVTKGDVNEKPDSWTVPARRIRGTVLFSMPLYGYLVQPTTPGGSALYLVVAGLVLVIAGGRRLLAGE
jgi:signal peptidase